MNNNKSSIIYNVAPLTKINISCLFNDVKGDGFDSDRTEYYTIAEEDELEEVIAFWGVYEVKDSESTWIKDFDTEAEADEYKIYLDKKLEETVNYDHEA